MLKKIKRKISEPVLHLSVEESLKSHQKTRARLLKRLEREVVSQKEETPEKKFEETEHELQEEPGEASEGLGIEKDEEKGEEAYPELDKFMKDPELKKDEDEEED